MSNWIEENRQRFANVRDAFNRIGVEVIHNNEHFTEGKLSIESLVELAAIVEWSAEYPGNPFRAEKPEDQPSEAEERAVRKVYCTCCDWAGFYSDLKRGVGHAKRCPSCGSEQKLFYAIDIPGSQRAWQSRLQVKS